MYQQIWYYDVWIEGRLNNRPFSMKTWETTKMSPEEFIDTATKDRVYLASIMKNFDKSDKYKDKAKKMTDVKVFIIHKILTNI